MFYSILEIVSMSQVFELICGPNLSFLSMKRWEIELPFIEFVYARHRP